MADKRACVVLFLVFGLVASQCNADFGTCYKKCYSKCITIPGIVVDFCSTNCVTECTSTQQQTDYFCKLGCASSLCTKISTKANAGTLITSLFIIFPFLGKFLPICTLNVIRPTARFETYRHVSHFLLIKYNIAKICLMYFF